MSPLSHFSSNSKFEILETTLMRWAQRHTDIAAREGRGVGGTQQILYTIFHNFVYLLLTNGAPFTYLAYNFVSVLTAGNPHCHKIGISHKYRTLSRRVRGWTSGRSLPVQIFVEYFSGISGGASPYRPSYWEYPSPGLRRK